MSNNINALLVLEPREPKPDCLISIIDSGEFDSLTLLHSNYRRLYESVDQVLNIYLASDFKHPHRDLPWIVTTDPLRHEHLHEALKPVSVRLAEQEQKQKPDPVAMGLF